jgi:hypothetical protein
LLAVAAVVVVLMQVAAAQAVIEQPLELHFQLQQTTQ